MLATLANKSLGGVQKQFSVLHCLLLLEAAYLLAREGSGANSTSRGKGAQL
jgi:hypothetical protein